MIRTVAPFRNLLEALDKNTGNEALGLTLITGERAEEFISFRQLKERSLNVLGYFQSVGLKPGSKLIFQVQKPDDFIVSFWACLMGGIIPVPVAIGNNDDHRTKVFNIYKVLGKAFLLADITRVEWLQTFAANTSQQSEYGSMLQNLVALEAINEHPIPGVPVNPLPDDIAFIQFSSGSTGNPKGVVLTHKNLLINTCALANGFQSPNGIEKLLSWMPLTHDMGLIGFHLTPLVAGWSHAIIMTDLFIRRPGIWLAKVAEHGSTITASPNFGYEYVLRYMNRINFNSLDLGKLRILLNGAEPISYELCQRFTRAFEKYHLGAHTIFPGYGMAEASLAVSVVTPGEPVKADYLDRNFLKTGNGTRPSEDNTNAAVFVCVGRHVDDCYFRIADSEGIPLPEKTIGEVQISGENVMRGYWNNEKATSEILSADGWLSTGDLGYIRNGELYITGRKKDIIFINGTNLYPHDLEKVAEEVEGIELGKVAIVGIEDPATGKQEVAAFVYYQRKDWEAFANISRELMRKINSIFSIQLDKVLPIREIPRTTSGKLQRYKLAALYREGFFNDVAALIEAEMKKLQTEETIKLPSNETEKALIGLWQLNLGLETLSVHDRFFEIGGTSLKAAELAAMIIEKFGLEELTTNTILEYPTIQQLAAYIDNSLQVQTALKAAVESSPKVNEVAGLPAAGVSSTSRGDVAVIGMAASLPGAPDISAFWQNLVNGRESIRSFDESELLKAGLTEDDIRNPAFVNKSGILDGVEFFDHQLFGYTPTEAARMSPQMRMYHQCVWASLEDAGYAPSTYEGRIGLYTGATADLLWDAGFLAKSANDAEEFQSFIFNMDYLSTRVSYKLGLKGPSFTFNTACSSSLVAIQLAYRSIVEGDSDMAIAGGVSIIGKMGYNYQEGMIMSRDGHCRAFDAAANGTVRGSGVGVVVLKKLEEAVRDNDHIYAVIKGAALNNDGNRKIDYTAPSIEGQYEVIRQAHRMAGIDPEDISYVEAHGTGTRLGDPIEIEALKKAFNTQKRNFCALGSVKTNLGHLEIAAGVAGFIKTVLMLDHKYIVPSLHYNAPNPNIDFKRSPFYVASQSEPWETAGKARIAGVSSFGIGGTNAHIIIQEAPERIETIHSNHKEQLVLLSANAPESLTEQAAALLGYIEQHPDLDLSALSYTLQAGRNHLPYRKAIVTSGREELTRQLMPGGEKEFVLSNKASGESYKIVFMFSGGGSQYVNMGRELYLEQDVFRHATDECLSFLDEGMKETIRGIWFPEPGIEITELSLQMQQISIFHPVIFIFEYAVSRLLMQWGIKPDLCLGHSLGEYVAACLAGVFSLKDALEIVIRRGLLMQSMPGGAMMSVSIGEEELVKIAPATLSLAAVNTDALTVVSGSREEILLFAALLDEKDIHHTILHISHAAHSYMMDPILGEYEDFIRQKTLHQPQIPIISTSTGNWINNEVQTAAYWSNHLRTTVRFRDAVTTLLKEESSFIFLELGAGKSLSTFVRQHAGKKNSDQVLELVRHPKDDISDNRFLLDKMARLYLFGVPISWAGLHTRGSVQRISLPTYPFKKVKFPVSRGFSKSLQFGKQAVDNTTTPVKQMDIKQWFYVRNWKQQPLALGSDPRPWKVLYFTSDRTNIPVLKTLFRSFEAQPVFVIIGEAFKELAEDIFEISPQHAGDYRQLLEKLREKQQYPEFILHAWLVQDRLAGTHEEEIEFYIQSGWLSLVSLATALQETGSNKPVQIRIMTSNCFDESNMKPGKAVITGPLRVMSQEFPQLACTQIDFSAVSELELFTSRYRQQVIADLFAADNKSACIRYQQGKRWVECFEKVSFPAKAMPAVLRTGGCYMITGGLGEVGFILSKHLARQHQATLVITGRTAIGSGSSAASIKLARKRELEAIGSRVYYYEADVADPVAMQNLFTDLTSNNIYPNGIVHAAGILDDDTFRPMQMLVNNTANIREQIEVKVEGARNIYENTKHWEMDFCLVTSSISAIVGGSSFCSYSAVNAYTDAFIQQLNVTSKTPWVTVNFDVWESGLKGMNLAIAESEGQQAFDLVLTLAHLQQVVISVTDLEKRISWLAEKFQAITEAEAESDSQQSGRPDLLTAYEAPQTQLQKTLLNIWQEVLGYKQLGIHDDFFELGADSLKAVAVSARIKKEMQVDIPLRTFFSGATIGKLSAFIEKAEKVADRRIVPAPQQEYYPMSSSQKRFYLLQQMATDGISYNMPQFIPLKVKLSIEQLTAIFQTIAKRHEAFRTSFHLHNGTAVQKIHDKPNLRIDELKFSEDDFILQKDALIKPFDLSQPTAFRLALISIASNGQQYLFLDAHHIIFDGISLNNLISDFYNIYNGNTPTPLQLSYKDFAVWENDPVFQQQLTVHQQYWNQQFQQEPPVLNLPVDYTRPKQNRHQGNFHRFYLDKEPTARLHKLAQEQEVTLYMLLLTAYYVFLNKVTGQRDIVVGTPVAGRQYAHELNELIGVFLNTLPLRMTVEKDGAFISLVNQVKQLVLDAFGHQDYPFDKMLESVSSRRDSSRHPLFDVFFALQSHAGNLNHNEIFEESELYVEANNVAKFDLNLTCIEIEQALHFTLSYNSDLFKTSTILMFEQVLRNILEAVVESPRLNTDDIRIISASDRLKFLQNNEQGHRVPTPSRSFASLFDEQVKLHSQKPAIIFRNQYWSFERFSEEIDIKARALQEMSVTEGDIIALMLDRSPEMVACIYALLKMGCAYLPVDHSVPESRLAFMLEDAGAKLLVTDSGNITAGKFVLPVVHIESLVTNSRGQVSYSYRCEGPAYIMYTSGTTGQPKGVTVALENLRYIALNRKLEILSSDIFLQWSNYSFDGSVFDLFASLLNGAGLVIVEKQQVADLAQLTAIIIENKVSVSFFTTAMFNALADHNPDVWKGMRKIFTGGEKVSSSHMKKVFDATGAGKIVHVYGPTETTVFATMHIVQSADGISTIPIGKPLDNAQAYIVDENLQLLPPGIHGELIIGGEGVSNGYINQPAITREKFVQLEGIPGTFYRSGDVCRLLDNGSIEYIERLDQQVKLRGYRIEPGEVEQALRSIEGVADAVVMVHDEDSSLEKHLTGYVTGTSVPKPEEIKTALRTLIPAYMIPSFIIILDALPLNINKKVDKNALPRPDFSQRTVHLAPATEEEKQMVECWSEALNQPASSIGITDNFFELGGSSLKMAVLTDMIRRKYNRSLSLYDCFENPTVTGFLSIMNKPVGEIINLPEPALYKESVYSGVTPAQERMYILQHMVPENTAYNMFQAFELKPGIDVHKMEMAFVQLLYRHESLRTSFHKKDNRLLQQVHEDFDFNIPVMTIEDHDLESHIREFIQPFNLSEAALLRVAMVNTTGGRSYLFVDMHHIVADGVSVEIMLRELNSIYAGDSLSAAPLPYRNYASFIASEEYLEEEESQRQYWLQQVAGALPVLDLPVDFQRPSLQSFKGGYVSFDLQKEFIEKLQRLSTQHGASLHLVMLTAYYLLLHKLTAARDIIVGLPFAGRKRREYLQTVGVFVNTLPVRLQLTGGQKFFAVLKAVKKVSLDALDHQEYPFEKLVAEIALAKDTGRNPVFDVLFNFFQAEKPAANSLFHNIDLYSNYQQISKLDLSLMVLLSDNMASVKLEYASDLFREETISRFAGYYQRILARVAEGVDFDLDSFTIIPEEEIRQQLQWGRGDERVYPVTTLHQLLEEKARTLGSKPAVKDGQRSLSYEELDRLSNRLAMKLCQEGVGEGDIVGILMDRSSELVVSIFAILKTGATYLPISTSLPESRVQYILRDSGSRLVITQPEYQEMVILSKPLLYDEGAWGCLNTSLPLLENGAENVAYVIYTSGSTGMPKGVRVQHKSVVNQLYGLDSQFNYNDTDVFLLKTAHAFDVSVSEIFGWLPSGGSLVVLPVEGDSLPEIVYKTIVGEGVTILNFVPGIYTLFLGYLEEFQIRQLPALRYIHFAGEALSPSLVNRFRKLNQHVILTNIYGPTEATVYATSYTIPAKVEIHTIYIGKPVPNYQVYLLDDNRRLLPVGVTGELYIGGRGLSLGYLNQEALTSQFFVNNPFQPGEKLYKTNDLVRWTAEGNIEYLGRKDFQVKLNGLRIELGDIEHHISKVPGVNETVVTVHLAKQEVKQLCAYYTGTATGPEIKKALTEALPSYMIPVHFIHTTSLPLNASGKIDRKQLPSPEVISATRMHRAPVSYSEKKLVGWYSELLHRNESEIGVDDGFFELGGNSLKATFLAAKISKEFRVKLSLTDIFKLPAPAQLAEKLKGMAKTSVQILKHPVQLAEFPLAMPQKKIYYLYRIDPERIDYNMPYFVSVKNLHIRRFMDAANKLYSRHEALRTAIVEREEEPLQVVLPERLMNVEHFMLQERSTEEMVAAFVRPFDLSAGYLLRFGLLHLDEGSTLVMIDMHHIISDGLSLRILLEELELLYKGSELSEPSLTFKDYIFWQEGFKNSPEHLRQLQLWNQRLSRGFQPLRLPLDFQRPSLASGEGRTISVILKKDLVTALKLSAKGFGITHYMYLLTAYAVLLHKLSSQDAVIIGTPVSGRHQSGLESIVGMFVNTLPIKIGEITSTETFASMIEKVKEQVLFMFDHQEVSFDDLVENLKLPRQSSRNPLIDVLFLYENIVDDEYGEDRLFGIRKETYSYQNATAKFDITMACVESTENIQVFLEYRTELFRQETMEAIAGHYQEILQAMVTDSRATLGSASLVKTPETVEAGLEEAMSQDFMF